jgi:hypothetical protein
MKKVNTVNIIEASYVVNAFESVLFLKKYM